MTLPRLLCPILFFVAIAALGPVGCNQSPEPEAPPATKTLVYDVDGMTCESCVSAITSELAKRPEVRSVDVSLEQHKATIECTEDADPAALHAAIVKLGFEANLRE